MARLPGYLRVNHDYTALTIRLWHPSLLVELWRMLDVKPAWAKPLCMLMLWWGLLRH